MTHNHQAHDISDAASLLRRVRIGDQPNSDCASSPNWLRPKCTAPRKLCCFPLHTRGLEFICSDIRSYRSGHFIYLQGRNKVHVLQTWTKTDVFMFRVSTRSVSWLSQSMCSEMFCFRSPTFYNQQRFFINMFLGFASVWENLRKLSHHSSSLTASTRSLHHLKVKRQN